VGRPRQLLPLRALYILDHCLGGPSVQISLPPELHARCLSAGRSAPDAVDSVRGRRVRRTRNDCRDPRDFLDPSRPRILRIKNRTPPLSSLQSSTIPKAARSSPEMAKLLVLRTKPYCHSDFPAPSSRAAPSCLVKRGDGSVLRQLLAMADLPSRGRLMPWSGLLSIQIVGKLVLSCSP
jgi:hypothetical protein